MRKILLAGSTGYLGSYIAQELHTQEIFFKAIIRNQQQVSEKGIEANEILIAELTKPKSIIGCCQDIDIVISTVGITRQKDGLTYMDVDYQANMNLLTEARKSGVKKFIYVSALHGEKLKELKIFEAKEQFVDRLKESGLDYCVIRPNGFFSDISEFFKMAQNGRVYLFGDGEIKANPIHGADLATVCIDAIDLPDKIIEVGGPEVFTQNQIATIAFDVLGKPEKVTHIPNGFRLFVLRAVRLLTSSTFYGPIEFFLTVLAIDMIAPKSGTHKLKEYFMELHNKSTFIQIRVTKNYPK